MIAAKPRWIQRVLPIVGAFVLTIGLSHSGLLIAGGRHEEMRLWIGALGTIAAGAGLIRRATGERGVFWIYAAGAALIALGFVLASGVGA